MEIAFSVKVFKKKMILIELDMDLFVLGVSRADDYLQMSFALTMTLHANRKPHRLSSKASSVKLHNATEQREHSVVRLRREQLLEAT